MKARIHPTAIVENGAKLADGVEIGAYAYIGPEVTLGEGTVVQHHATVEGLTTMGERNVVYPYAMIGGRTQDLKFSGGNPGVKIGDDNCFREYTTVHSATKDGDFTIVGSNNNILAYSHIAHDCILGDWIIASNYAGLAGHVQIGSHAVLGGMTGIHQFCRIGEYAMTGGMSRVVQDICPFMIAEGSPARTRTINLVGLERNGFDAKALSEVKTAYRILFKSGLTREKSIEALRAECREDTPQIARLLAFFENSERGVS
ncbi:MAG TPA: acyl-ACP--UDP-N-acetylglucosamine O-acyltransferase [Opitutales bacterium]|nr:acyl-ACP--UDP-N-acetylglucosamine O-acyltransferase [Opitutales bacterium]